MLYFRSEQQRDEEAASVIDGAEDINLHESIGMLSAESMSNIMEGINTADIINVLK